MKGLNKRLEALEGQGPSGLEHLSDEGLAERIVAIFEKIERHGAIFQNDWREACRADPIAFDKSVKGQIEAML